jgi:hypothetical protein
LEDSRLFVFLLSAQTREGGIIAEEGAGATFVGAPLFSCLCETLSRQLLRTLPTMDRELNLKPGKEKPVPISRC